MKKKLRKKCIICERWFRTSRDDARHCGQSCRRRATYRRQKAREQEKKENLSMIQGLGSMRIFHSIINVKALDIPSYQPKGSISSPLILPEPIIKPQEEPDEDREENISKIKQWRKKILGFRQNNPEN